MKGLPSRHIVGRDVSAAIAEGSVDIAVKKAKTFETEAVIKAFEGMTYEGPLGAITMRKEDHQAQSPVAVGEVVKKTKYYDFPYLKPIMIVPAAEVSATLEESGWKPYKE